MKKFGELNWIKREKPRHVVDIKVRTVRAFCARRWENMLDCTMACDLCFPDREEFKEPMRIALKYIQEHCPYNHQFGGEKPRFNRVTM